ncbi:hypothetical protein [[Clostridium] symbiosum]|uniref:hypothetical protein n=1 Tax=Clostridium symbiosum TaxID=1512 RepID=UPI001D06722C|nr:hypothetical protein [[Clostridium] symbiosum]
MTIIGQITMPSGFPAETKIEDAWDRLPKGHAFLGSVYSDDQVFLFGYIYPDERYGSILWAKYNGTAGIVFRKDGIFTRKNIQFT